LSTRGKGVVSTRSGKHPSEKIREDSARNQGHTKQSLQATCRLESVNCKKSTLKETLPAPEKKKKARGGLIPTAKETGPQKTGISNRGLLQYSASGAEKKKA